MTAHLTRRRFPAFIPSRSTPMKIAIAACLSLLVLLPATSRSQSKTPMTSSTRMIASGGHTIAFHVTPGRLPAIVLDAGGGLDSTYWDTLVPEVAKRTGSMVITYDRSGFGASDEVKGPWSVKRATDDLATGLAKLGATRDVILVSHSLAGEIATCLTQRHPRWFAGAVLVDANVPDYFTDATIAATAAEYAPAIAAARAAPPSPEGRQLLALSDSFVETSRAFHSATWPTSVPVIVIVSEKTPANTPAAAQWWRDAHARFAKGAANRRLVVAERSSHDVARDRPDVILQAIADIAAKRR
jgi:pimeloyl-ACP methyl ester carboxylesterase